MKNIFHAICLAAVLLGVTSNTMVAQSLGIGEVNIYATTPKAAEADRTPGAFTIVWSPGTNLTTWTYFGEGLRVFYYINGTAANGMDYQAITNFVTVPFPTNANPAVRLSVTLPILPINDTLVEGEETVALELFVPVLNSQPPYKIGLASNAVVTIADNEGSTTNSAPTVRIVSPTNGAVFTPPASIAIFAEANDPDGSVQTVEFFAGTRSLGIVTNNPYAMSPLNPWHIFWTNVPAGTYRLTAVATDDLGLSASSAPIHIAVQEVTPPRLLVNVVAIDAYGVEIPVVPPESDRPQLFDPGIFRITRSEISNLPLTVGYTLTGTASNGVDYEFLSNSVTIPAGAAFAEIVVAPIDDFLPEPTETVMLKLQDVAGAAIYPPPPGSYRIGSNAAAIVYIRDNDYTNIMPIVEVVATDLEGSEIPVVPPGLGMPQRFDPAIFTVTRRGSTDLPLTVHYRLSGAALNGIDYEFCSNAVVIPAGANSAQVVIAPIDDFIVERTESVVLALNAPACIAIVPPPPECYMLGSNSTATVSILDNDTSTNLPPVVTIAATDPDASEDGEGTGSFTISRTGATDAPLRVYYGALGTAQNGIDYLRVSNYVVIPTGAASADVVITPIDDTLVERSETVLVQLRPALVPTSVDSDIVVWPTPYVIGSPSNAVVNIADNDVAGTNLPPMVRLTRPTEGMILRAPANVGLMADAQDHDGFVRSVQFFEGTNSLGFATNVPTSVSPSGLWFLMWSNAPVGRYTLTAQALDDDGAGTISAPVRISVVSSNLPPPPTNTIPLVSIAAVDSVACEGRFDFPTTVIVQSNLLCANAAGFCATSTWVRLDGSNSVYWTNVFCGTNTATFEVRRSAGTNELTVYYTIQGTASNGVDYVALPGSVTIPAGQKAARIVIVPVDDTLLEYNETVVLTLVLPTPSSTAEPSPYALGRASRAAAVIVDNEYNLPPVRRLSDGLFHVFLPAAIGSGFRLETSSDLTNWTPCLSSIASEEGVHYIDPDAPSATVRFYRLVPEPAVIPEE